MSNVSQEIEPLNTTVGTLINVLNQFPREVEVQFDSIEEPIEDPELIFNLEARCDDVPRLYVTVRNREPEEVLEG